MCLQWPIPELYSARIISHPIGLLCVGNLGWQGQDYSNSAELMAKIMEEWDAMPEGDIKSAVSISGLC